MGKEREKLGRYCARETKFSYVKGGVATQYALSVAIDSELSKANQRAQI